MEINPSEVTKILKEQIKNFGDKLRLLKSVKFYQLETVSLEFMALTMLRLERWLNFLMALKVWP